MRIGGGRSLVIMLRRIGRMRIGGKERGWNMCEDEGFGVSSGKIVT